MLPWMITSEHPTMQTITITPIKIDMLCIILVLLCSRYLSFFYFIYQVVYIINMTIHKGSTTQHATSSFFTAAATATGDEQATLICG
jgi:hypothetical protein